MSKRYIQMQQMLESSRRIIDLGCGNNPIPGATVAVDCFKEPKERSLGHGSTIDVNEFRKRGIEFVNQRIDIELPFKNKEFDFAYSAHVFEHLDDPATACREMMRIAKAGVIITPSIFAELAFGRPYHKWLVMDGDNMLFFFAKQPEEYMPFGNHPNPFDIALNDGEWYKKQVGVELDELRQKMRQFWYGHSPVIEVIFLWQDSFNYNVILRRFFLAMKETSEQNNLENCELVHPQPTVSDCTAISGYGKPHQIISQASVKSASHDQFLDRLPIYRIITETDLNNPAVRRSQELAKKLRESGMKNTNLENYWQRVIFIAKHCSGRVLEIGCGCGNITRYISQNPSVTHVCAIDKQPEYISQLLAYDFPKVQAICTDLKTHAFQEIFDCIVMAELIEHLTLAEEIDLLMNIRAILNPGAIIIITTPIGFMPDPAHVRGFSHSEFQAHILRYYGQIVAVGDNGVQQFAVVRFDHSIAQSPCPRVSVVLPTYNHVQFLPRAVHSILAQTFTDFELIIVNDGSTDGSREYLDSLKDPRIRIIHQENKRLPEALNAGFRTARGELITWISSDNYCAPIFLEALVAALDNYPDAGFAYSAFAWINEKDQITGVHRDQNYTYHSLLCCNPGTASFMYRRICQDQVGLYDPGLEGAEDWDMWLRIAEQFSTVYVPEILYYYRLHNNSMTAKISEQVRKSAQETFVKALMRKNNHLNVADLYPSIALCKDQASAKFHAYFDMGTALLQSPWFNYQTHGEAACQFLEKSLSILPTSFIAAGNLVVAYARSRQWEKAIHLLQQLQNINHPQVAAISDKIRKASYQNDPELLLDMPLFTVDKSSLELFQLEHKQKRIFSFTDSVPRYYNNTDGAQLNKSVDEIPYLSISFCIITNGKRSDLVKLVIKSIHAQNIPHYEIIVVGRYHNEPEIVYLPAEASADAGKLGLMRNIAVSKTKYNNITMLDDDIILSPDWYKAFKEYGNAFDILTSQIRLPDGGRYWDHVTYGGPRGHIILDEFEDDNYIYMTGGGGWVMKKHVASSVAWDEKMAFYEGEDLDFARRCLAKGFKIAHNRTMLVYHADTTYTLVGRIILRRKQGHVQQWVESVASSLSASQIFEQAKTYESKDLFAEAADLLRIGSLKYPDYVPFRNAWIDLENKFGGRLAGNLPWFCNGDPQYLSVLKRYQNE